MSELSTETLDVNSNLGGGAKDVPNATAALVLGICSIVFAWSCISPIGLTCGIIALFLSSKGLKEYKANPSAYKVGSYKNANAGKICAIIGTCIAGIFVCFLLFALIFYGSIFSAAASSGAFEY